MTRRAALVCLAITYGLTFFAAGAPGPLLAVYDRWWSFGAGMFTVAFAVYAIGFLVALLTLGSLSDRIGRKPVAVGALIALIASLLMLVFAPSIEWVVVARVVQGLASGALTGSVSAWLVELAPPNRPTVGTVLGAVLPPFGIGGGALVTGFVIELVGPSPQVVFGTLATLLVVGTIAAACSPESVSREPVPLSTFIPQVAVPRRLRAEFLAVTPLQLASWMAAALFAGLAPLIVKDMFHIDSGALNGLTTFAQTIGGGVGGFLLPRLAPRLAMLYGSAGLTVGMSLSLVGLVVGVLPLLWIGGTVLGLSYMLGFAAALRLIGLEVSVRERAGVFSALYIVAYIAFGGSALLAGWVEGIIGLPTTMFGFCATVILLGLLAVAGQLVMRRRDARAAG